MTNLLKVLESDNKMRLDVVAARMFPNFCMPKDSVYEGDEVEIDPIEEVKVSWGPEDIQFEVCYEEEDFLIINKPYGLVMHPGSGCYNGTLANGLLYKYPQLINLPRSGIVHRLDKDTSGVLVVAKTDI
jgi:23S rRNA pseudouridine1911/1915/1917 synthase